MADLADKLETPLAIYKYLYNNINTEYYNGSRKGALGTYEQNGGDDAAGKFFNGISKNPFFSELGRGALYLFPEPERKNNVNTFFVSLPLEEANKKYKKGSNVKMGFNINDEIRELAKGIIKNANDFEMFVSLSKLKMPNAKTGTLDPKELKANLIIFKDNK